MDHVIDQKTFAEWSQAGSTGRKGPVFIEIPLDIQAAPVERETLDMKESFVAHEAFRPIAAETLAQIATMVREAKRPVLLLGGGVSRVGRSRDDDLEWS
jgi:acetolactate synthase-1/2/3 large subunit